MNNIPFREFINTYNFRYINNLQDDYNFDTQIIRIYPPSDEMKRHYWFEFGVYDFSESSCKQKIIETVLSKEILESYVESISFNQDYENVVTIYLTKEKKADYY